jgi:hypothetical protein
MYKVYLFCAVILLAGCKSNFNTQKYTHFKRTKSQKEEVRTIQPENAITASAETIVIPPVITSRQTCLRVQAARTYDPQKLTCSADQYPVVNCPVTRNMVPDKLLETKAKQWSHHKRGLLGWLIDTTLHLILFCLVIAAIVVLVILLLI